MKKEKNILKSRRDFLGKGFRLGAMLPLLHAPLISKGASPFFSSTGRSSKSLKILILGGTGFLGPQQIAYALERGHSISTFNRGRTKPTTQKDVFSEVEQLIGDRENNLEALMGRKWDAVIDNSGSRVKWTRDTARLLKENVDLYLYTSSTGVYYPYLKGNIKEEKLPVLKVPGGINEVQQLEYDYGVMKANSENEAIAAFGKDHTIIVRPTYMMGPGDQTDRFTYWPVRLSKGGNVLVPGKAGDPVQYIDVRDVAEWMIRLIENHTTGTFNAVGPVSATGMHAFVFGVHAAFSSSAHFTMIPDYDFLKKHDLYDAIPWIMPVDDNVASALINNEKAVAHGLRFTPLAESVKDIITWWNSDAVTEERRSKLITGTGSLMSREKAILDDWSNKK